MPRATILGAGIVGCSVALAARSAGFDVTMIADRRMSDPDAVNDPSFASAFPAASTIPHTVPGPDALALTTLARRSFATLSGLPQSGVRLQRHFELWEEEPQPPPYAHHLLEWSDIATYSGRVPIRRSGAGALYGYTFKMHFADMPVYAARLETALEKAGIAMERQHLNEASLSNLNADIVINCLGAGAAKVFPELAPGFLYRGRLLKFPCDRVWVEEKSGEPVSYNYTPVQSIHPAGNSAAWDVYFYPRENSCVLGGTRELGILDPETGAFIGQPYEGRTLVKDNVEFPQALLELNRELVMQLTGRRLADDFQVLTGYRHIHGTFDNPRLVIEQRIRNGRLIIDCLGFGGAGVTLSWGAAIKAAGMASLAVSSSSDAASESEIEARLIDALRTHFG